jgi:hypothetical protein
VVRSLEIHSARDSPSEEAMKSIRRRMSSGDRERWIRVLLKRGGGEERDILKVWW